MITLSINNASVLREVQNERQRQDAKWGEQNHEPFAWLAILGEEVGEANKAAVESHFSHGNFTLANYREELIHVAAVAIAAVASLDRNEMKAEVTS